jgi:Domain of unknown function (DUF4372)/Transposase DDE domain
VQKPITEEDFEPMIRTASLFSQLLHEFPRLDFQYLIKKHQAEKGAKGFTCWMQFVAMMFCHLGHADSLREICNGLSCCIGKLNHLGMDRAPKRSTLSYANEHRPAGLFQDQFWYLLERFRNQGLLGMRKKAFRFKNKLLSLDSTTISLCLSLFPWASFRRAKGGVKVHVLLDHDDYLPSYVWMTEARQHDKVVLHQKELRLNPGSIVVFDRAYNDYCQFGQWTEAGVFFVTRLKENAHFEVIEERPLPGNPNLLSDQIIQLTGPKAEEKCPYLLRRVVVWDEENQQEIVLLTNHLGFAASTLAAIYKDRWQIEIFFKTLKQNLKVKTFIGTTENALRIQIWTALIALLLLRWLQHLAQASWSFSNLASMLRLNLFTYRDLKEWLLMPFGTPPEAEPKREIVQLALDLRIIGQPVFIHTR